MQILCVGIDHALLASRCAVLASHGYDARPAMLLEAEELLITAGFDLIILSAMLSAEQKSRVLRAIPGATRTLILESLVAPPELLRKVAELFDRPVAADVVPLQPFPRICQY
jgi:DNA-binding response OmpR family regulator